MTTIELSLYPAHYLCTVSWETSPACNKTGNDQIQWEASRISLTVEDFLIIQHERTCNGLCLQLFYVKINLVKTWTILNLPDILQEQSIQEISSAYSVLIKLVNTA